jgi:hypothetical protein
MGHKDTVALLLTHKADVHACNEDVALLMGDELLTDVSLYFHFPQKCLKVVEPFPSGCGGGGGQSEYYASHSRTFLSHSCTISYNSILLGCFLTIVTLLDYY